MKLTQLIERAENKGYYVRDPSLKDFDEDNPVCRAKGVQNAVFIELCSMQKWLREDPEQKTHILIYPTSDEEGTVTPRWLYTFTCRYDDSVNEDAFTAFNDTTFETYELALQAAIEHILNT